MITDHLRSAGFAINKARAELEATQRDRTDAALVLIDADLLYVEEKAAALRAALAAEVARRKAEQCIWCGRNEPAEEILAAEASGYQIAIADAKMVVADALDPRRGWDDAQAGALAALEGLRGHAPGCSAANPCCSDPMDTEPG